MDVTSVAGVAGDLAVWCATVVHHKKGVHNFPPFLAAMIIQHVLNTEHIMNHDHIGTYRDKHNVNEPSKAHVWLENILPPFEEPLFGRLKLSIVSPATCHIKKCQKKDKQTMCII